MGSSTRVSNKVSTPLAPSLSPCYSTDSRLYLPVLRTGPSVAVGDGPLCTRGAHPTPASSRYRTLGRPSGHEDMGRSSPSPLPLTPAKKTTPYSLEAPLPSLRSLSLIEHSLRETLSLLEVSSVIDPVSRQVHSDVTTTGEKTPKSLPHLPLTRRGTTPGRIPSFPQSPFATFH